MQETPKQVCPICDKEVYPFPRHPKYVCLDCIEEYPPVNRHGKQVSFSNVDWTGGFASRVCGTTEKEEDHVCFVKGVLCWADEARFGGIVIEVVDKDHIHYNDALLATS